MMTALHTGFHTSELLSLTWEDVDFRRRVITVRAVYVKNGKSRSVPMNEGARSQEVRSVSHPS